MSYLTVKSRTAGDTFVVYIDGYLNSLLGEEVERLVAEYLDAGGRRVLLNFGGTRLRIRNILVSQDLRPPMLRKNHCFHVIR